MSRENVVRRRSYFDPSRKLWTETPVETATFRLDAQSRMKVVADARNVIYERDSKGGWSPVLDQKELTGKERGLLWEIWPTETNGTSFVAFRGLRVLDEELRQSLLAGLSVWDEDGTVVAEAGGLVFLLDRDGAAEFVKRLRAAGGEVVQGDAASTEVSAVIERLQQTIFALEKQRALDADLVARVKRGEFIAVAQFHERTREFLDLCAAAPEYVREIQRLLRHLLTQQKTEAERARAAELLTEARALREQAQALSEARDMDASEIDYLHAQVQGRVKPRPPAALRLLAFREVGNLASQAGFEVEQTETGVKIKIDDRWLTIGPDFQLA